MKNNSKLYDDLGIGKDASPDEVRSAYRSLAQRNHPDKEGGNTETFQALTLAYKTLSDPEKRKQYDATGETSSGPSVNDLARGMLADLFAQMLGQLQPDELKYVDVTQSLRKSIIDGQLNINNTLRDIAKEIKGLMRSRLRITKDCRHIFCSVIDSKIDALKASEKSNNELKEVSERMLVLLDDFEWQIEVREDMSFFATSVTGGATTTAGSW